MNESASRSLEAVRAPLSAFLTVAGATLVVAGTALFVAQDKAPAHYVFASGLLVMCLGAISRWLRDPMIVVLPAVRVNPRPWAIAGAILFAFLGARDLQRGQAHGGIFLLVSALIVVAVIVDALRQTDRPR